jgi:hypothetical protein
MWRREDFRPRRNHELLIALRAIWQFHALPQRNDCTNAMNYHLQRA